MEMYNPFRLSQAVNLAIHALIFMAREPGRYLSAKWLGRELGVSEAHLSKVLNKLASQGILKSVRGSKGGFTLAVDASSLTMLDIVQSIDGPMVREVPCLLDTAVCKSKHCMLTRLQERLIDIVREELESVTLEDFVRDVEMISEQMERDISEKARDFTKSPGE